MASSLSWSLNIATSTSVGNNTGQISVPDVKGFYVFQKVGLAGGGVIIDGEIKSVIPPFTLIIGSAKNKGFNTIDLSALPIGTVITAGPQPKANIPDGQMDNATYEAAPANAQRVINVNEYGDSLTSNPMVNVPFDAIQASYPSGTEEDYAYFAGGLSGTQVANVQVIYTDSTKASISSVVVTYQ
jgi:hypothetical protein